MTLLRATCRALPTLAVFLLFCGLMALKFGDLPAGLWIGSTLWVLLWFFSPKSH